MANDGKKTTGWQPWHGYAAILFVIIAVFFKTLAFRFVRLDDLDMIVGNHHLFGALSQLAGSFGRVLLPGVFDFYRPVLAVSLILDAQLGGTAPFVYHLTNIVVHSLAACLLYLLLGKLGYRRGISLSLTLLFAAHPALVQAVAWVPGRNDTLLGLFVLASFLSLFEYLARKKAVFYVLHIAAFALALFTKENAVAALFLFPFFLRLLHSRGIAARRGELMLLGSGWLGVCAAWFVLRSLALGPDKAFAAEGFLSTAAAALPALAGYIGKAFIPVSLSVFPSIQDTPPLYGWLAAGGLLAALLVLKHRDRARVWFGIAWFLLFLLPTFVAGGGSGVFYEHRLYVPLMGLLIAVAELLPSTVTGWRKGVMTGILAAFCLAFAAGSYRRCDYFLDRFSFWEEAAASAPHSAAAHSKLAGVLEEVPSESSRAEQEYLKSLELSPRDADTHMDLGIFYYRAGRTTPALEQMLEALRLAPEKARYYRNLGAVYARLGDTLQSRRALETAARIEAADEKGERIAVQLSTKKER